MFEDDGGGARGGGDDDNVNMTTKMTIGKALDFKIRLLCPLP